MTLSDSDTFLARMRAEADQHLAEVLDAKVGDHVTAPRGGEPCILVRIFRDGGRLLTHDGTAPADFRPWCACKTQPDARYFEQVGGQEDGSHGWFDARCGKVFQWG